MLEIGKYHLMEILRETDSGLMLSSKEQDEILLPGKFIPEEFEIGQLLEVFVYLDNKGRPIATTQDAKISVYEFALLKVKNVSEHGAFLDMGIDKDLFVPFGEQASRMENGKSYLTYMYLDGISGRLTGSTRLDQFLENDDHDFEVGNEVEILCWKKSDLGFKVIVQGQFQGLIHSNDIHRPLHTGLELTGFIHKVREDGKLDIRLEKAGYDKIEPSAQYILEVLQYRGGFLLLNDKSEPERIKKELSMSKKTFKKAIGLLFKERKINIEKTGIRLI